MSMRSISWCEMSTENASEAFETLESSTGTLSTRHVSDVLQFRFVSVWFLPGTTDEVMALARIWSIAQEIGVLPFFFFLLFLFLFLFLFFFGDKKATQQVWFFCVLFYLQLNAKGVNRFFINVRKNGTRMATTTTEAIRMARDDDDDAEARTDVVVVVVVVVAKIFGFGCHLAVASSNLQRLRGVVFASQPFAHELLFASFRSSFERRRSSRCVRSSVGKHNLDVSRDVSKRRRPFVQEHRKTHFQFSA